MTAVHGVGTDEFRAPPPSAVTVGWHTASALVLEAEP